MKQKKGQIFLITAILTIVLLSSFFIYRNRITFYQKDYGILSLKGQLSEESSMVIDYGIANNDDKLEDFLGKFSSKFISDNPNLEMIFFYGNGSNLKVVNLAKDMINISLEGKNYEIRNVPREGILTLGESIKTSVNIDLKNQNITNYMATISRSNQNQKIKFNVGGIFYEIDLQKYKNFYFILRYGEEDKSVEIE